MNKLDVVVTIPNDLTNGSVYPYKNIPLIKSIAMKLICLLYADKGSIQTTRRKNDRIKLPCKQWWITVQEAI